MSGTPIAKMVREMIARGVDPDVIELAVATAETAASGGHPVDKMAENRRAYDRDRQRLKRLSTGVSTGHPVDADSALSSLVIDPVKKEEKKKERAQRGRGEKIPPDWTPAAEHFDFGKQNDRDRRWVEQQAEDMRIWARTNEHRAVARKSDWNLTFTGWLRRTMGNGRSTGPPGRHDNPSFAALALQLSTPNEPAYEPDFDLGPGPVIDG